MKKKWNKVLKIISLIILAIVGWTVITGIVYDTTKLSDVQLKQDYDKRETKIELLKQIRNECIIEGEKIAFENIQNNNVKYNVLNNNKNIIFNYWIVPENYSSNENPYKAKITLTKDYKVIDEEINIKSIAFEKYKENFYRINNWMSLTIAGVIILALTMVIGVLSYLIKHSR